MTYSSCSFLRILTIVRPHSSLMMWWRKVPLVLTPLSWIEHITCPKLQLITSPTRAEAVARKRKIEAGKSRAAKASPKPRASRKPAKAKAKAAPKKAARQRREKDEVEKKMHSATRLLFFNPTSYIWYFFQSNCFLISFNQSFFDQTRSIAWRGQEQRPWANQKMSAKKRHPKHANSVLY